MKTCPKCKTECRNDAVFCYKCGNPLEEEVKDKDSTVLVNSEDSRRKSNNLPKRNIALCVVLSVVTCGIYGIYWMIMVNDEINEASGDYNALSGGLVFLLSLVTCGIYSFYWAYKMGEKVDQIDETSNGNSAILYLVLSVLGLGIINLCFMQDALNGLNDRY